MVLEARVDTKQFDKVVKFWPVKAKMELGDALDNISLKFLKEFKKQRLQGPPGIRGHPHGIFSTFKRTFLVSPTIDGMGLEVFSPSKVAAIHETGGVVRNSKGGRLAVPLSVRTEMFTQKGKLKKQFKDPRSLKNVFPVRINAKEFLVRRRRRETEILPLYVLKSSVRLKARLGFFQVWDSLQSFRLLRIQKAIHKVLESL